jgi:hypothetical protein
MFEFSTTEIPSKTRSGRTPMDNPFIDVFPSDERALTFMIKEGRESLEARRVLRQVRQAAKAVDRTGRVAMRDMPGGAVQVTVWTVDKIVRKSRASKSRAKAE